MPELPEIETIKHVIEPQITGLAIEKATVLRPEVIAHPAADEFCKAVTGQTVLAMERRGKYLIFHLTQKSRVILHLRMTGCLLVAPPGCPMERHTHVVLQFSNGMELRFSDTRRFGRFWLISFGEEDTDSGIGKLGPEPFSAGCNAGYLQARLGKRKKAIKACLLDQSVVAGIGNIYSDEILFRANINPARPAGSLTAAEWQCLAAEIPQCLAYFIEKKPHHARGILANQRAGLRQHALFAGVRPRRRALPALRHRACPHRCWRQKQRILPALPGRGGGMRRDGEENSMKYCKKRAGGIHYVKAHT